MPDLGDSARGVGTLIKKYHKTRSVDRIFVSRREGLETKISFRLILVANRRLRGVSKYHEEWNPNRSETLFKFDKHVQKDFLRISGGFGKRLNLYG